MEPILTEAPAPQTEDLPTPTDEELEDLATWYEAVQQGNLKDYL